MNCLHCSTVEESIRELSLHASFVLLLFPRHVLLAMAEGKSKCAFFTAQCAFHPAQYKLLHLQVGPDPTPGKRSFLHPLGSATLTSSTGDGIFSCPAQNHHWAGKAFATQLCLVACAGIFCEEAGGGFTFVMFERGRESSQRI